MLGKNWERLEDMKIGRQTEPGVYEFLEFNQCNDDFLASWAIVDLADYKYNNGDWDADTISDIESCYGSLKELRKQFPDKNDEEAAVADAIFICNSDFDEGLDAMTEDEAYSYLDDVVAGKVVH